MEAIFSTSGEIVKALANTLIHSIWIGAVICLGLRFILSVIDHRSSFLRYTLSIFALFSQMAVAPLVYSIIYQPDISAKAIKGTENGILLGSIQILRDQPIVNSSWQEIMILIYIIGLVLFLFRLLISFIKLMGWIRLGNDISGQYGDLLDSLRNKLGIRKKVQLVSSLKVQSPTLYGFFRPVILVPLGMLSHMPIEQVEVILLHELVHIRRLDFLANIIQHVCEVFFFFNPFVWIVSAEIRKEREKYCDDYVLKLTKYGDTYAKALLNLSLLERSNSPVAVASDGGSGKQLLFRINRILNTNDMKRRANSRALLSMLIVLGIGSIIILSGFRHSVESSADSNKLIHLDEVSIESILPTFLIEKNNIGAAVPDTIKEEKKDEHRVVIVGADSIELAHDYHEELREELLKVKEEIERIKSEEFKIEVELARKQMDSVYENIDFSALQYEIQAAISEMEEFDIHDILLDLEHSMQDIDFDFDFDHDFDFHLDIDLDSLMQETKIHLESIDIEALIEDLEEKLRVLENEFSEERE